MKMCKQTIIFAQTAVRIIIHSLSSN